MFRFLSQGERVQCRTELTCHLCRGHRASQEKDGESQGAVSGGWGGIWGAENYKQWAEGLVSEIRPSVSADGRLSQLGCSSPRDQEAEIKSFVMRVCSSHWPTVSLVGKRAQRCLSGAGTRGQCLPAGPDHLQKMWLYPVPSNSYITCFL